MNSVQTSASLASLLVGEPKMIQHGSKEVLSGIFKTAIVERVFISKTGIQGDGQGDMINHGGEDKAICAYFHSRYPYWEEQFDRPFVHGSFGENFTISGWTEDDLFVGDIITIGEVTLQISQPRQPCFKLGIRNDLPTLPLLSQQTGYTGFYFRVMQEGYISVGDHFNVIERHPEQFSIADANHVMYVEKDNVEAIQKLLAVDALAASWKNQLSKRLDKLIND
ncbi:MOSC domain-containing protein [Paenibacillus sp. GSMTC-2017]|uniref:MOSC domain-containing protein n=1 Tax=Paenibacillus sp. GSMTC-2017 TaxID=2794350 RepID=UPI0018D91564|nr:MOSC domain-containing protein [Paenibacillus sp. GSMTC-2017]MBH5317734.1 MOSC domain-containing protein [Paenibacillus sp. GSMTC-2017]